MLDIPHARFSTTKGARLYCQSQVTNRDIKIMIELTLL